MSEYNVEANGLVYDENDELVGTLKAGRLRLLTMQLPDLQVPDSAVKASLVCNMDNDNADITVTAVDYGVLGNQISIVFQDPGEADQDLSVSASGKVITVGIGTGSGSRLVTTAGSICTAIAAVPAAAALITAAAGGTGEGIVNALAVANLAGGKEATPGPVGCLCFDEDNNMYRKTSSLVWDQISEPPA